MIPSLPPSRTEPQLQATPRQMAPHIPLTYAELPSQEPPKQITPHTPPARAEQPLQETSRPIAPHTTIARVQSPLNEASRPISPHTTIARVQSPLNETSRPRPMALNSAPRTRIERPLQQDPHPAQSPCIDHPTRTMPQSVGPTFAVDQAVIPSLKDHVNKQTLEQEMPEQKFGEPIKSTALMRNFLSPSQTQAVNGYTSKKRRAFSRKPLLPLQVEHNSQPVPSSPESLSSVGIPTIFRNKHHLPTYTPDGTALYGKVQTITNALDPNASPENHHMSQQAGEASVSEDSDIDHVSGNGGTTGRLVEAALQEAAQSIQERTPEISRGSRWGLGSLIESARSVTRRLGFSPLTTVSEISESILQTPKPTMVPMQTKKNSLPTSVRAKRAKHRRHIDSVAKSAKPIHIGPGQRDKQPRAKKATPASGATEATATDAEHSPATRRTHRDQEEARLAQSGESEMTPTIRFPSRSLDRMATKRKRWGSPDTIPNPKGKSYGLGEAEFYGNFDETEKDGVTEQQPGKIRRTSESGDFSSQVAGNPHKARPYTGSMFEKSATEYNGGNVFSEYEAIRKAEDESASKVTNIGRKSLAKTPIPITNPAGTFKVPSPGDSDWSDSESDEEVFTAGLEDATSTVKKDGELGSAISALSPSNLPKSQHIVKPKKSYLESLLNPPSSRVVDQSLLERPFEGTTAEPEALRKARDRALQHKPRNPSTLSQSSRTYSSPSVSIEDELKADKYQSGTQAAAKPSTVTNTKLTDHLKFNAYEDWCKTASPAVTAALGGMEVDPNLAGNAFSAALDNTRPTPNGGSKFNAFEEWSKTASPTVTNAIGRMEMDPHLAGDAFSGVFDNSTNSGKRAGQEEVAQSRQAALSDTFGSILPSLRPFTPLIQYGITSRVEDYLNSQWDEEDEQAAITEFRRAFQIFQENESATAAMPTAGLVA